jgi:hypothetical protein
MHVPPAEGERRAIGGYFPQYRIASSLVLRHLRDLQWIRVADQFRVDAFQVKWSQHPDKFSFTDLTTASSKKPSLIAQLADGCSTAVLLNHCHCPFRKTERTFLFP